MKYFFIFIVFCNVFCLHAQTKDSTNVEIGEVVVFGLKEKKCRERYDQEKDLYQKQFKELKTVNFETLFDELFKLKEFKDINADKNKLLLLNPDYTIIISTGGNDYYSDCRHYEKHISPEVFHNVWTKKSYSKFQSFFKNKIIVPLIESPFLSFEENIKNDSDFLKKNNIKPILIGKYIDSNGKKKKFYYSSNGKSNNNLEINYNKNQFLSQNFNKLEIKIYPSVYKDFSNVYGVHFSVLNEKNHLSKTQILYHYIDGGWRIIEENKITN